MNQMNETLVIGNNEELFSYVQSQLGYKFQIQLIEPDDIKKYTAQLVIVLKTDNQSPLDIVQSIITERPKSQIIYVSDEEDFELLRDLIRLGVLEYIVLPDEDWLLLERAQDLFQKKLDIEEDSTIVEGFKRGGGKVFTFYSGKGGSGKSLISTSFAQTLKLESTAKVLFIDLNMQYGGAETYLGLETNRSIIDLLPVIHELSAHHIRNIAAKEEHSGLEILASPRDPELGERIDEDFIMRLLRASKRSYDFIIVDVPSWMDERVYMALEESERIYYLMSYDTVALKILKGVEGLFKQLGIITEERLELVMNFTAKDNELSQKDIERFVSYPNAIKVRRDYKGVQTFINQGVPLRREVKEKKLPPVAKDIRKWVRSMLK